MKYEDFEKQYPGYVLITKESCMTRWNAKMRFLTFYNAYGKSAEIVHKVTGYKLRLKSNGISVCGGSKLINITEKLKTINQAFCIFDGEMLIDSWKPADNSAVKQIDISIVATEDMYTKLVNFMDNANILYEVKGGDKPREKANRSSDNGIQLVSKAYIERPTGTNNCTCNPSTIKSRSVSNGYCVQERKCENCMEHRNGNCSALRNDAMLCGDYTPAPMYHKELAVYYPQMGLASWIRQNGRY